MEGDESGRSHTTRQPTDDGATRDDDIVQRRRWWSRRGGDGIRPKRVKRNGYDVGGEGKDEGEDGSADGDDDDKAIGGEVNVCHPNHQSTNNGGKQMQRAVWGKATRG